MSIELTVSDIENKRCVALIPARAGSKRVKDKNIRDLGGFPCMAYTIICARLSGVFDAIVLSTDSERYAEIGRQFGAEAPFLRPLEMAGSDSPDIEWVRYTLQELAKAGRYFDCFSVMRPTSPFRRPEKVKEAFEYFVRQKGVDSLRAVEPVTQHPGKMWVIRGERILPLLPFSRPDDTPWHSSQSNTLPRIYVQNASLELAWSHVPLEMGTIAGETVLPWVTEAFDGFDINSETDWQEAEHILRNNPAILEMVHRAQAR